MIHNSSITFNKKKNNIISDIIKLQFKVYNIKTIVY